MKENRDSCETRSGGHQRLAVAVDVSVGSAEFFSPPDHGHVIAYRARFVPHHHAVFAGHRRFVLELRSLEVIAAGFAPQQNPIWIFLRMQ
jgi:hypothetical protein